jgi:hypothetical protein
MYNYTPVPNSQKVYSRRVPFQLKVYILGILHFFTLCFHQNVNVWIAVTTYIILKILKTHMGLKFISPIPKASCFHSDRPGAGMFPGSGCYRKKKALSPPRQLCPLWAQPIFF